MDAAARAAFANDAPDLAHLADLAAERAGHCPVDSSSDGDARENSEFTALEDVGDMFDVL